MLFQPAFILPTPINNQVCHRIAVCSPLAVSSPLSVSSRSSSRTKHRMSFPSYTSPSETTPLLHTDSSSAEDESVSWRETWKFARPYVTPATSKLRILAVLSLACELGNRAVSLLPPFAYKLAVDALSTNLFKGVVVLPYGALLLYFTANLTATLFDCLADVSYSLVESDSSRRFAIDLYKHLLNLSLSFHLGKKTGEIAQIMDRGIESIDTIAHAVLFTTLPTYVVSRS